MKVLIVDDSALMRRYLRQILETEPDVTIETARDGEDALKRIESFDPDVVTLDINMPVMDGLTCLAHIMERFPRPVLMVSSLTEKGALATFEALELGAVDYIAKPGGTVSLNIHQVADEIRAKVRSAARSRQLRKRKREEESATRRRRPPTAAARRTAKTGPSTGLVLIGVSTGGPQTLEEILPKLPADFPLPVVVAQHMPSRFTSVFAQRFNGKCELTVPEVNRTMAIEPGTIYIGRGDADVRIGKRAGRPVVSSVPALEEFLWHPSVEYMVRTAMEHYDPKELIAVQLTGMGYDGAAAMTELHQAGGRTIAEAEETAVVFGMPRELIERGGAECVLPREEIAAKLVEWTKEHA